MSISSFLPVPDLNRACALNETNKLRAGNALIEKQNFTHQKLLF